MAWVERCGKDSWRVRFRRDDDTIGAIPGFPTKKAAQDHADTMESDQRQGTWLDPQGGKTLLREWTADWLDAQDIAVRTEDYYRSLLDNHIHPRWGDAPLADITGIKAAAWAKKLRKDGYADSTVTGITKLLSLLLADAAEARLIPAKPIRPRRRDRHAPRVERVWATPEQALAVADNAARLPAGGPGDAVMIVLAAWTGARWGEITGLQRHNIYVSDDEKGYIKVDSLVGALLESSHGLELGPPKTPESAPPDQPGAVSDPADARPSGQPRPPARLLQPARGVAPAQQLLPPRPPTRRRWNHTPTPARRLAPPCQAGVDLPWAAPWPQDLDDRGSDPRGRAIPPARPPPRGQDPRDLLPRRRRSRIPPPAGPGRPLEQGSSQQPGHAGVALGRVAVTFPLHARPRLRSVARDRSGGFNAARLLVAAEDDDVAAPPPTVTTNDSCPGR
jgi:hypothetical protein